MAGQTFVPAKRPRDLTKASNAAREAAADLMVAMVDELPELKANEIESILKDGGHIGIEITMAADGTGALSLVAVCADATRLVVSTILAVGGKPSKSGGTQGL